jgi:hypothetical protein
MSHSDRDMPRTPATRSRRLKHSGPKLQALEQRMMFDGAAVADATAAAASAHDAAADLAARDTSAKAVEPTPAQTPRDTAADNTPREAAGPAPRDATVVLRPGNPAADGGRHEIAFIDSAIDGWTQLAESIGPGIEVVLIDSRGDGLAQIASYLEGKSGIDAIHIIAHGAEADATFGSLHLTNDNIAQHQADLARLGAALSEQGDLLLYGCDIAKGADGMSFIGKLAEATGADVAASSDTTGSVSKGGDWVLEERVGSVEVRHFDLSNAAMPDFVLGPPSVTSVDDMTYTEGSGPVVVDNNITITGGTSYDGRYIRFTLTNGQTTDTLGLNNAANVNASGAISISGSSVYLGNGSGRDVIGTVDATENGQNGQALRINFVSTFTNSSFESGLTGWTTVNTRIDLGVTSIAGFVTPNDATNPASAPNRDNNVPTTLGTLATASATGQATDGSYSARLSSTGMTTAQGFDVVHGPAIYSDVFSASSGDAIYFDWRALAGSDAYDVFGYLLNTTTGATTEVLNATGTSSSGTTAWATASASIPTSGNYRFVFVSGTYDFSGGRAAGASLYIDNVRVYGSKVNDAVVTNIARQVTFAAGSDSPATSPTRVFTVTAMSATNQSSSDTGLINITSTNDAPTLSGAAQSLNYTENGLATPIDSVIVVADPDNPANFNGGYLQAQVTANGAAEDHISVLNQGTGAGQIGVSGNNVTYGGVTIGTIDGSLNGANNTALRINLNGSASVAATQALARVIAYRNSSDAPSTAARTVTFTLNDGGNTGSGGALSGTRTATVNVTAVDDPTVMTLSNTAATYLENNNSFYVDAGVTLVDVDSTTMNGARVVIGAGFRSTEDQLRPASGTNSDGISYSYDAAKGVLTLSGTATIAQYQAALRAVQYNNTSDNPDVTPRTITMTLGNVVALTFGGINHYYEVVTGPASWTAAMAAASSRTFQGLTGYLATITSQTENDFIQQKLTADAWIGASDDYLYINVATGTTTYANQAAAEGHWYWVSGPERGTRISDNNGSPVTVSGGYAYWNAGEPNNSGGENYGEIYSTGVAPGRWNDLPNSVSLAYVVEYSDAGGVASFSKSITITPQRVNDAPVTSGSVALTSINENASTNSGQLVSSFMTATDPDTDPVTGIAITSLSSSRGTWQYSLDNGATWANVGAVSNASALLLNTTDRVRFVPDGQNADAASISYRAWDRSNENSSTTKAGQKTDVSTSGGTTAYSSGTQTGNLTVTAVNDAPVLVAAAPTLTTISEDATGNGGQTLASFLGSSISDVDTGAQQGVAITSLSSGNGTWEYSINGGSSWVAVGTVAGNSALLLRDTDLIRFRPDGQNATTASFSYKAWDRSSGTQGNKVDTTVGGGTTAFSTAADTTSITVTAVNDAPVLSGAALSFATISEDNASSAGQTVASLLGSTLTDVDAGAVQGIAITAATVAGTGHWEYDSGSGWTTLGAVSGNAALLLRASDKVRYVPDLLHGGTPTLTVRGWDTSTGTAGSTADTTTNGGTSAFSAVTSTASISVTELNDAPVFNTAANASSFTEMGSAVAVGSGLVLTDDGSNLTSASVRISAGFTSGDTLAVGTPGGLTVAYNAATGVLTLSGSASVATYQAALRSVSFVTSSEDPTSNSATRTLSWQATDSANLTSAASTSTLTVTPTADAPVMASVPTTWSYVEDDGTRIVAPTLTLSDLDDTRLSGATLTISGTGYLNDGFELLSAVTTGTAITASFDGSTGVLTLSGTDSVANYQKVMRSITYTNTRDYNNPSAIPSNDFVLDGSTNARSFSWQVTDANSDGANGSPTYSAQSSLVATTTVTLYNANEVPQVSNVNGNIAHINYTEGGAPATLEGLLTVQDDGLVSTINSSFIRVTAGLEAGDQLGFFSPIMGWTRTGTPTSGTFDDGGGKIIAYSWSVATGDMTLTTLSGSTDQNDYTVIMQSVGFVSTSDDPTASNPTRTLIWRVTDSGGLQSAVTASQSTIIDITATDDAPSVSGLPANGDVVFIENGAEVVAASGLTLTDPDDTKVLNATVQISGSGFVSAVEYLSLPGASVSAGSDWSVSNINGSGIDASYSTATGMLTLTAVSANGVDIAAMQALLRQVNYGSTDNDPTNMATTRTLTWNVTDVFGSRITDVPGGNDGDAGATSSPTTSTITLSPRNDAPTLNVVGTASAYTERAGTLTLVTNATTVTDVDDALMSRASVWISGGFTPGDTLSVGSPLGLTVSYDSATGQLNISGTASKTTYNFVLRSVRFSNSSSDDPTAISGTRTMSWSVTDANTAGDGAQTSSVHTTTLNITATDDPVTVGGLGSASFTENGSTVPVAPSATLTDLDDSTMEGLTVTISAGRTPGDLLTVGANLSGTGITVTAYDSSTGALVLSGTASLADYQAALRSIVFTSSSDDPAGTSATRTLTWSTTSSFASRLTDGTGANDAAAGTVTANAGTSTINITALNDAPVVTLDDGTVSTSDAPIYEQGSAAVFALQVGNTAGGITITDADIGDTLASASVRITGNLLSSDLLSVQTPAGWSLVGSTYTKGSASITVNYNSGSGTLSFSGTATRAEYQELLGSVKFSNGSVAPTASGASRELTWSVTDSNTAGDGARSASATSQLIIRDRNDAPIVVPASPSASYTEGDASVSVPALTITDPDPGEIVTATLTVSNPAAGQLSTSGNASYNASTGVWTMTDTVANVNAALAALSFSPATNNDVAVTISYTVADGGEDGAVPATGSVTLNVTAVNDAPVLTPASPALTAITEDDVNNAGQSVSSFRGVVTDVDTGTYPGIAITGLASGNGTWQYSTDGGTSWTAVGSVSPANALLLRDSDFIRFVPNGQNGATPAFDYRAWDGSTGSAGNKVDASSTGNATAYSSASDTATLVVASVNDAPVLADGDTTLTAITEDDTTGNGTLVSDLLTGRVSDVDSGSLQGIAVTGLNSGNGYWQYSLDAGATWTTVATAAAGSALLLRDTDRIRFVPDARNGTSASFDYRAWDRSTGTAGSTANTTAVGAAAAFSSEQNTATQSVTGVNDAPVLAAATPVLTALSEDDTANAGQTVASLLGASVSDVDSGALQGIAITDTVNGNGRWQYSLDNGTTWANVGTIGANTGLLLASTDRVRFVPDGMNATTGSITFAAWDHSTGTAGSTVSTAVVGGSTAFSSDRNTATITASAVNDAPVLAADAPVLITRDENDVNNAGQTVASFIGATISDVDSGALAGIAITGSVNGNGGWQYSLDGGSSWASMGGLSATQSLLLRPTDRVRFVPDARNDTTGSLSYRAWDQTVGSAGGTASTVSNGGTSAFSSGVNTASISITPVNDASINDVLPSVTGAERVDGNVRQDALLTATPGTWHDVDNGAPAPTFSYQWQVADDLSGINLQNLAGATATQLLLTDAQVARYVRVQVISHDGTEPSLPAYSAWQLVTNVDPVVGTPIQSPLATEAVPYSFKLPGSAFVDANGEDTMHFTATLADGSPLPSWLSFDEATRTFSGTPTGLDVGKLQIRVTVDDRGGHPVSQTFEMSVAGIPQSAPSTPAPAPAAPFVPPEPVQITVVTPRAADSGNGIATPDTFSPPTSQGGAFAGGPLTDLSGIGRPASTGTDFASGYTRGEGFQALVPKVSSTEALMSASNLPEQVVRDAAKAMDYTLAPDTFIHTRTDAVIQLSASRTDGQGLPAWLQFDAKRGHFTGTPPAGFEGDLELLVTARDNFGNVSTVVVKIRIAKPTADGAPAKVSLSSQLRLAGDAARQAEKMKLVALAREAARRA